MQEAFLNATSFAMKYKVIRRVVNQRQLKSSNKKCHEGISLTFCFLARLLMSRLQRRAYAAQFEILNFTSGMKNISNNRERNKILNTF